MTTHFRRIVGHKNTKKLNVCIYFHILDYGKILKWEILFRRVLNK